MKKGIKLENYATLVTEGYVALFLDAKSQTAVNTVNGNCFSNRGDTW